MTLYAFSFRGFARLMPQEENSFLVHNMLWIGFFGETYTGMIKTDGDSEWTWPEDAVKIVVESKMLSFYFVLV